MPGRGPLTFKKRQRELHQKEKQAEKLARKLERKLKPSSAEDAEEQVSHLSPADMPDTRDPEHT
jgi:hypothetical protein